MARFLIVSTSVLLFVRSLFVFVNSFFHGFSHSSKAGRLGVSAERSPSERLFSIKAMRWSVSCLEIITSFFCGENFLRVIYQFWIYLTEFFHQCAHVYLLISGYFQLTSRLLASREEPFWRKHGKYNSKMSRNYQLLTICFSRFAVWIRVLAPNMRLFNFD